MVGHPYSFLNRPTSPEKEAGIYYPCELDIALQAKINADARCIFHAMTMPEYVEVWMSLPFADGRNCTKAIKVANSYRIDFYRLGELDTSVTGLFKICQTDKIVLTWRKFGVLEEAQSIVNVLIQEASGRSVVTLRHVGLPSLGESRWHTRMWSNSLRKLARLLDCSAMVDDAVSADSGLAQ